MAERNREAGVTKSVIAMDTFEGFLEDDPDGDTKAGKYAPPYDVKEHLTAATNVWPVPGDVRDTLHWIASRVGTFAFVLLDTDTRETIAKGLDVFSQKMSPGGIIVVDDYGRPECRGAKPAVDDFLKVATEWEMFDYDKHAYQAFLRIENDEDA